MLEVLAELFKRYRRKDVERLVEAGYALTHALNDWENFNIEKAQIEFEKALIPFSK